MNGLIVYNYVGMVWLSIVVFVVCVFVLTLTLATFWLVDIAWYTLYTSGSLGSCFEASANKTYFQQINTSERVSTLVLFDNKWIILQYFLWSNDDLGVVVWFVSGLWLLLVNGVLLIEILIQRFLLQMLWLVMEVLVK